ncbi:MAG: VUT family protein, partial [Gammaproteobacteria bacterium]|nr:VUT family protein [Gammaproteobacteria bacterium]
KMAALIVAGSALTVFLNWGAWRIALASTAAFAGAATIDGVVYHVLGQYPRWLRVNGSNVPSAFVDSLLFPALAFGFPLLWGVMAGQFLAKVGGGALWLGIIEGSRKLIHCMMHLGR